MRIALVNTNRIKPPIAPLGLEYIAETVVRDGHDLAILDLCFEGNEADAINDFFSEATYDVIGVTIRNTDDCAFVNRESFVDEIATQVARIRKLSTGLIVLGGVGFSTMPSLLIERCKADAGILGDGELAFSDMLARLQSGETWRETAGLVWRDGNQWQQNPPDPRPLSELPKMGRDFFDNRKYFRLGGQIGFETKRGCPMGCVYCADPVAKGRTVRNRPPTDVCDELEFLLQMDIDHFHTCDCEFNIPIKHAMDVCDEIIARDMGSRMSWYAYCSPTPFTTELAHKMRRAGCRGINFGVDSGDDEILRRLKRQHRCRDILAVAETCRAEGITTMFDLLLGTPGESEQSIERTISTMKQAAPDRVGVALGVRIYPGTPLEKQLLVPSPAPGVIVSEDPLGPVFYIEPAIAETANELISRLIGSDTRFLFFDASSPKKNYNYNANDLLIHAIHAGMRGAYWDILRRLEE